MRQLFEETIIVEVKDIQNISGELGCGIYIIVGKQ